MEVIDYQKPQSWSDKGMTWDASMNPVCIDYAVAIREAIHERCAVTGLNIGQYILPLEKYAPINYLFFSYARKLLQLLAPYFVNLDYQDYKEDFSDAPKYWSWRELNVIENCRICEIPSVGCAATEMISWMIRAKNYLNKLTVCKVYAKFKTASGAYTEHSTWFDDACKEAIKQAKENYNHQYSSATFQTDHFCDFGSYENNVPVGSEEDQYCSTAGIKTIWDFKKKNSDEFFSYNPVVFFVADTAINQGYPHQWTVMQRIVWDNSGFSLKKGITVKRLSSWSSFEIMTSTIFTNTMKPRNNPPAYYATSLGIWGTAYFLGDYGVDGGFKFRP